MCESPLMIREAFHDRLVQRQIDKPDSSTVHSSKSNGVIERCVQEVQGMVRTLRSAVEERLGVKLAVGHVVWPWLVEFTAWLLTRAEVGHDGRTTYERIKGKSAKLPWIEFGEGVLWKRKREGGPFCRSQRSRASRGKNWQPIHACWQKR